MKNGKDEVPNKTKIALVACGVLALDCKFLQEHIDFEIQMHYLPGGLHTSPPALRRRLQETIDAIDKDPDISRIVVGYGLCGHGTAGLQARTKPLIIPRVHDCIALFLGSDQAYREQFSKAPGTYYLSAGWVEEKEDLSSGMGSDDPTKGASRDAAETANLYGADNAAYIEDFMQSWTRNYTRAAFIDTGVGGQKERYAKEAESLARKHGWQYERIPGTHNLLNEALHCTETSETMLCVPPGSITSYDALHARLTCSSPTPHATAPEITDHTATAPDFSAKHRGIGIGIDAGGTYTDAVLFDFDTNTVLAKNKALTTHWDYSYGIREALAGLDPVLCRRATLVAVSTTLATNAIVEHRGQAVGLLVMPPCGWQELDDFQHKPVVTIKGQMAIEGTEREPVNPEQVRNVAQELMQKKGVTAFAVGGYAAHINPAHELQVKALIQETTGLICTCSHELSNSLHYRVRAETAALNARIIPCLEELLQRVSGALDAAGVTAPVMVVRSDGSFMRLQAACERPLETMLSGPAASAAGAGWLANIRDGLIVDIGGTTTDTALLQDGQVAMNPEGASIGGWQTHIQALDLQTSGLGGDSCIRMQQGSITIGPDRVIPLAWTAAHVTGGKDAIARVSAATAGHPALPDNWILLLRTRKEALANLSERENQILSVLATHPMQPEEVAAAIGVPHPRMLPLQHLLEQRLVAYSGFTPTDALHVLGTFQQWDAQAALDAACSCAGTERNAKAWATAIVKAFQKKLAAEIARMALHETLPDLAANQRSAEALLDHLANRSELQDAKPQLQLVIPWPIIGIGAPAGAFTPGAAHLLAAKCNIPAHADVANAVGAIIGNISVRHMVRIATNERGTFRISGASDAPIFSKIEDATQWCIHFLHGHLGTRARHAGCSQPSISITRKDRLAPSTDGTLIFVAREIHGHAHGSPIPDA